MQVTPLRTFTIFDGSMKVFNRGIPADLPDHLADEYVAGGLVEPADKSEAGRETGDAEGASADGPPAPPPLTGKNKAALLEIAANEGVVVDEAMTNKAIVEAIEAGRETGDAEEAPTI